MGAPERVNQVVYALIFSGFDILCTRLNSSKKVVEISGSSNIMMFSRLVTADSVTLKLPFMTQIGSRAAFRPVKNL